MDLSDKTRQGGITIANPNRNACSQSITVLSQRKGYINWGSDSCGHAWMYRADSRADCHPCGLINEELDLLFNVSNTGL